MKYLISLLSAVEEHYERTRDVNTGIGSNNHTNHHGKCKEMNDLSSKYPQDGNN